MSYNTVALCLCLKILCVVYCQENENWTRFPQLQMDSSEQCPPWHFFNATLCWCEYYSSPSTNHIVKCTKRGVLLRYGYCMTHKEGQVFLSVSVTISKSTAITHQVRTSILACQITGLNSTTICVDHLTEKEYYAMSVWMDLVHP